MKKRFLYSLFSLACILTILAGCGKKTSEEDSIPLVFWTYVEQHTEFFDDAAATWNEAHPNETIALSSETYPVNEMHSKFMITIQSGDGAPDLADINVARFSDFIFGDTEVFVALNDAIEPEKSNYLESVLDIYKRNGNYYGIEYHVGAPMMFYNTEILGQANVKPEDIVTWYDLHDAGKKVLAATGKPIITFETRDGWSYFNMIGEKKSDYFDANGNCIINNQTNVQVIEFMLGMLADGTAITTPGGNVHAEEFYGFMEQGGAASVQICAWYLGRFTDFMPGLSGKIRLASPPVWDENSVYPVYGGTATCITQQCKNQDMAKRFLVDAKISRAGAEKIWSVLGFDPLRYDIWESDAVRKSNKYTAYFGDNFFDVLMKMRSRFHTMNITASPKFSMANSLISSNVLFKALSEKSLTPQQALDEAYQEITSLGQ
jgi:arabinosaccharide transport system substrate-binding protein